MFDDEAVAAVARALAHPARVRIVRLLAGQAECRGAECSPGCRWRSPPSPSTFAYSRKQESSARVPPALRWSTASSRAPSASSRPRWPRLRRAHHVVPSPTRSADDRVRRAQTQLPRPLPHAVDLPRNGRRRGAGALVPAHPGAHRPVHGGHDQHPDRHRPHRHDVSGARQGPLRGAARRDARQARARARDADELDRRAHRHVPAGRHLHARLPRVHGRADRHRHRAVHRRNYYVRDKIMKFIFHQANIILHLLVRVSPLVPRNRQVDGIPDVQRE